MEPIFVAIRYHVNWPGPNDPYFLFNQTENLARKSYYEVTGVPYFAVDGTYTNSYEPVIWNRSTIESPFELTLNGSFDETTRTGEVTATIYAELDPGLTNIRLRIALIENEIYYPAPNGAVWHHQTFRDMIPNTYGQPFSISQGETLVYSFDIEAPSPLVLENCQLVAFIQCDANREVLQGARSDLLGLVSSVDEDIDLPEVFGLSQNYPNPFNADTQIGFISEGGDVKLEVYDLTGALVKTLVDGSLDAGNHSIIWDGSDNNGNLISSGVYFYKLSDSDKSEVKRMTLLK